MSKGPRTHIIIPDTQVRPGVRIDHLTWAGRYIAERSPDVVVVMGDWWDMPSLSSYDRGKKSAEGRRVRDDIDSGNEAMERMLTPMRARRSFWNKVRLVFLEGNHEQRMKRAAEDAAEMDGMFGLRDLNLDSFEIHPFLSVARIDGISYSHFFPRAASGAITQSRRGAPSARAQCIREGGSATAGHQQGLDIAPVVLGNRLQWGLIAGSYYQHDEGYLTPQGHDYWKGIVVKHDVHKGQYCPMMVDMAYLKRKYTK